MIDDNPTQEELEHIQSVLALTNKEKPKQEDLATLQTLLNKHPRLWRAMGDLAKQNQLRLLSTPGLTAAAREMISFGLNKMKNELGYNDSTYLEQMLIDNVVLTWLRLNLYENQLTGLNVEGMTFPKAAFWEKRMTASHSRYLRACEALARVRRLIRSNPAFQVNIATQGGQQVNIAGDVVKSSETG